MLYLYLSEVILDINQFFEIRSQFPLVDVRSENEFQQGHILAAHNLPILNNEERIIVGTAYKQQGQQQAIKAGFKWVGPRLVDIITQAESFGNEMIVHCWRGGMRSGNFCQFVGMAGVKTHQIKGGYKAYRKKVLELFTTPFHFIVLAGYTGSGKSELLASLRKHGEQVIDLEHIAHHKGSVFGGLNMPPQPTSEQFENNLFEQLITLDASKRIWIEDESIAIGKIFLPPPFWQRMGNSPIVALEVEKPVRITRLVEDYKNIDPHNFIEAMKGITKKLGGQHFNTAQACVLNNHWHEAIDILLQYYDKAYRNGLQRKQERIKLSVPWSGVDVDGLANHLLQQITLTA